MSEVGDTVKKFRRECWRLSLSCSIAGLLTGASQRAQTGQLGWMTGYGWDVIVKMVFTSSVK